jgi:hypothetical protein
MHASCMFAYHLEGWLVGWEEGCAVGANVSYQTKCRNTTTVKEEH